MHVDGQPMGCGAHHRLPFVRTAVSPQTTTAEIRFVHTSTFTRLYLHRKSSKLTISPAT